MNIQNILDTGYFTTSRARSSGPPASSFPRPPPLSHSTPSDTLPPPVPVHSQVPRTVYLAPAPAPRIVRAPPPTVEDELESLAREYGSCSASLVSDEETPSRGEVDQYPVLMEVHEHNPERRFVIVPEPLKDQMPRVDEQPRAEIPVKADYTRAHSHSRKTLTTEEGPDKDGIDISRYGLQRRKSNQESPPIDTELGNQIQTKNHGTKPAATGLMSDYFDSRRSRSHGDRVLSPDINSSGPKQHANSNRGWSQPSGAYSARSPSRTSQPFDDRDGHSNPGQPRTSRDPSGTRRSNTDLDSSRSQRMVSIDVDPRYRDHHPHSRGEKGDSSQAYAHSGESRPRLSPRPSRDPSRSGDENSSRPCSPGYLPSKPAVIQDVKPSGWHDRREDLLSGDTRSASRTNTFPRTTAEGGGASAAAAQMAHHSTSPAPREPARSVLRAAEPPAYSGASSRSQLPYPDDDYSPSSGLDIQNTDPGARCHKHDSIAAVSMPEPVLQTPVTATGRFFESSNSTPVAPAALGTSQTWTPGVFDPEKDGFPAERLIGSLRRYSENRGRDGDDVLPECPRQKPVAGKVDWLTLPHTSLNFCPSCYDAVFAKSEYRFLFKPMLRPFGEPIACDFGVSPWYRIAWLLTLKDDIPDLRLMQQISNLNSAADQEPCPGTKKAVRSWLTVKDPHTRLPVPDFSVCQQCARIVELLLPNLRGVFEHLDFRPRQDMCALHFARDRKEFVLFLDALETTSDKAMVTKKPPNVDDLARQLWRLTVGFRCREDAPVMDGYWHTMQFLPEFTVCANCFDEVVEPKLSDGNVVARNFYKKPQRLPSATCQLYSIRMREIFRRSCRTNDPKYLEDKVLQRRRKEKDIYDQLVKLDRANVSSSWKEEEVAKLVDEWKRWE